jgi:hypothetical protein
MNGFSIFVFNLVAPPPPLMFIAFAPSLYRVLNAFGRRVIGEANI